MRKTINLCLLAVLALSCVRTEQPDSESADAIRLKAENPGLALTKTTHSGLTPYWSVGDRIGVCQLSDNSNVPFTADITAPAVTAGFTGPDGQSGSCFAYYPYKENVRSGSVVSLEIAATQYPGAASFDGASDLLVSNTFNFGNGASMTFRRLTAVAKVILRDNTTGHVLTGREVERVKLTVTGVNLAGTVSVDGSNGSLGEITSGAADAVEAIHAEGKRYSVDGTSASFLNLYPRNLPAATPIRVEAWSGNLYVCKDSVVPSGGLDLRGGYVSSLLVDIGDAHVTCNVPEVRLNADKAPAALPAGTVTVNSLTQFNGIGLAGSASKAGTVVVLKNGTYENFQAYVNAYGTASAPLVIRAETPGSVILTGNSFICLNAPYTQIIGLTFANPGTTFPEGRNERICLNTGAHHCLVSRCKFDYSTFGATASTNICDIRLYCQDSKVEFCSFLDKKNMGPQIGVQPNDVRPEHLRDSVVYCYFTRPTVIMDGSDVLNGQESILLGLSRFSQKDQDCYVARNYFYKSDGEHSEVISVKGCNNVVEENFFKDSYGNLSLRHGKFNQVRRNFLVRSDNSLNYVNGITVLDTDNEITGNYLYNIPDKTWFAAISLEAGKYAPERSETDTEILKSFWQTRSCTISRNVIRSSTVGFTLNIGWSANWRTLHPINCTFTDNIVYDTKHPLYYYVITGDSQTADGHSWSGNLYSVVREGGGFHYDQWGQAALKNKIAYSFPDAAYEAAMTRISTQAGVNW